MHYETGRVNEKVTCPGLSIEDSERVTLCEVLDRVLNKGVVLTGEMTISVAGVDLIYLALHLILTSIETAQKSLTRAPLLPGSLIGTASETPHERCPGAASGI